MNQVKNEKYLFFTSTAQPSQDLIKQFFFVPMNHMSLWTAKVWCGVWTAYIILNIPRKALDNRSIFFWNWVIG